MRPFYSKEKILKRTLIHTFEAIVQFLAQCEIYLVAKKDLRANFRRIELQKLYGIVVVDFYCPLLTLNGFNFHKLMQDLEGTS